MKLTDQQYNRLYNLLSDIRDGAATGHLTRNQLSKCAVEALMILVNEVEVPEPISVRVKLEEE